MEIPLRIIKTNYRKDEVTTMAYIDVLNNILDSRNVTVGGGSASAISGAMAAGLIGMVARLSINKNYGLPADKHMEIAEELDRLNKELLLGSEEDTKAYLLIKNAYGLPKSTLVEKEERAKAINAAGIVAASVPKDNAYLCKRILELGKSMEGKYNSSASSDFVIGMELAKLGVRGCILNIEVNLPLIKEEDIKKEIGSHLNKLI